MCVDVVDIVFQGTVQNNHICLWGIVFIFHTRGSGALSVRQRVKDRIVHLHLAEHPSKLLQRNPAGAQKARRLFSQRHHGGFHPDGAWAAVQHGFNPSVHVVHHMGRCRGARMPGEIPRWRGKRHTRRVDHCTRYRMGGEPHRDGIQPCAHLIWNAGRFRQNDGQWTRPKLFGQLFGCFRYFAHQVINLFKMADVHNQRIVHRAALRGKNLCHRCPIQRIGRQAVDGLRRDAD